MQNAHLVYQSRDRQDKWFNVFDGSVRSQGAVSFPYSETIDKKNNLQALLEKV